MQILDVFINYYMINPRFILQYL